MYTIHYPDIRQFATDRRRGNMLVFKGTLVSFCLLLGRAMGKVTPTMRIGNPGPGEEDFKMCLSEACVGMANGLFQSMNRSMDPCENFYEFTCGRLVENTVIPEDKSSWSEIAILNKDLQQKGKFLLEKEGSQDDWEIFKDMRKFYRSCLNEDEMDKIAYEPLTEVLDTLGGWPVLEGKNWDRTDYKWYENIYYLNKEGYSMDMVVDLHIYGDAKNSTWRTIHLDQPMLGLSREYLIEGLEDQHVKAYFKYMQDITELMGADRNASEAELKDVLLFEMELAQISAPKEERRDRNKLYNPTLLKDFESLPGHPPSWTSFVDNLVYTHNITEDERVLIGNPEFFKKLSDVMTKASPRTLANYIGWRFVKSIVGITTRDARDAALEYAKVTSGTNELPARWETCVKATGFGAHSRNSFLFGTGSLYAKHYFPKEAKLGLKGLIRNVRASFKEILDDIDWMDDGTKGKAYEKLAAMDQMIGFPDEILEEDKVTSMYKGVQIQEGQHFQNILSLRRRSRQFQYERLREEVDKKAWHERATVAMVNALYSPTKNMILFPAGILGGFFFNTDAPPYHNYGAIGVVIGHEITHGFDDQGRRNDQNGDLADWWDEDTAQKFEDKAQCIINQANNFESAQVQLKLNGINTQGENIADNGGISEAYRAYEKHLAKNGMDPMLPGLPFTPRQLFWISNARVSCRKTRDESLKRSILLGAHAPAEFRVNGAFSNSHKFAQDFQCPLGSPMNPEKKCRVW